MAIRTYHVPLFNLSWGDDRLVGGDPNVQGTPTLGFEYGTEAGTPKKRIPFWLFPPDVDTYQTFPIVVPEDFLGGNKVRFWWAGVDLATAGDQVRWGFRLSATTAGDADTPQEHASATPQYTLGDPNTTEAGRLVLNEVSLSNDDGAAIDDLLYVTIERNGTHTNDDYPGYVKLYYATFRYSDT